MSQVLLQLEVVGGAQSWPGRYGQDINLLPKIVISCVIIFIILKRDTSINVVACTKMRYGLTGLWGTLSLLNVIILNEPDYEDISLNYMT